MTAKAFAPSGNKVSPAPAAPAAPSATDKVLDEFDANKDNRLDAQEVGAGSCMCVYVCVCVCVCEGALLAPFSVCNGEGGRPPMHVLSPAFSDPPPRRVWVHVCLGPYPPAP